MHIIVPPPSPSPTRVSLSSANATLNFDVELIAVQPEDVQVPGYECRDIDCVAAITEYWHRVVLEERKTTCETQGYGCAPFGPLGACMV